MNTTQAELDKVLKVLKLRDQLASKGAAKQAGQGMAEGLYDLPNDLANLPGYLVNEVLSPTAAKFMETMTLGSWKPAGGPVVPRVEMYTPYREKFNVEAPKNAGEQVARVAGNIGSPDPSDIVKLLGVLGAGGIGAKLTAWHGTPYKWEPEPGFPHGRPKNENIGKAAGTEAWDKGAGDYTYGHYFSEEKDIAKEYGEYGENAVGEGNLYKVEIPDEEIEKMMVWDDTISNHKEFYPGYKKMLDKIAEDYPFTKGLISSDETTAGNLYKLLARRLGSKETSQYLNSIGIPGLTYFDNRDLGTGKNYVIFDESFFDVGGPGKVKGRE